MKTEYIPHMTNDTVVLMLENHGNTIIRYCRAEGVSNIGFITVHGLNEGHIASSELKEGPVNQHSYLRSH